MPLVGDVDNGGGCTCVESRGTQEISVLCTRHCYDPKVALTNEVHSFNILNSPVSVYFFKCGHEEM